VDDARQQSAAGQSLREVGYRYTPNFPELLERLRCSLLVSTYQAGKLVAIGVAGYQLHFSFHNFDQAMGIAVGPARVAVGTLSHVWFLDARDDIARHREPQGRFDRCCLARRAHVTGAIRGHEMAWGTGGELWIVNTLFSCLATLHDKFSFVPRWRPPFITELAAEDRCHLNGLAMRDGRPALVTVMAETSTAAGWRANKELAGCVLDVSSGEPVTRGLAMPHSPRLFDGRMWVLNSGDGTLETIDPQTGQRDVVEHFPGYTRGLAFCGGAAFVGLSRIRETAIFGGLPIAQQQAELKCGIGVVDRTSGRTIATLEFERGVDEIFDVQIVSETKCLALTGPQPQADGDEDVWVAPPLDKAEQFAGGLQGHSNNG
jgi:uncharacterized protein (TIGR03032 family)